MYSKYLIRVLKCPLNDQNGINQNGLLFIGLKIGIVITMNKLKTITMETREMLIQDLADILHIHQERVNGYNRSAYGCPNMQLKMLLNRELDNARDSINSIKRLLVDRFATNSESESKGLLFSIWSDFKPSFDEADLSIQLHTFEMADLLTLQCYRLIIGRPYIDDITKNLLEFQYQKHLAIYNGIKAFRTSYRNNINYPMHYSAGRQSA